MGIKEMGLMGLFFMPIFNSEDMNGERRSGLKGGGIMTNISERNLQYAKLTELADRLQARHHLSPATVQLLAEILARISILELQLYGKTDIYCSSRRKAQTQSDKTPF